MVSVEDVFLKTPTVPLSNNKFVLDKLCVIHPFSDLHYHTGLDGDDRRGFSNKTLKLTGMGVALTHLTPPPAPSVPKVLY